jgi:hypothetical protein
VLVLEGGGDDEGGGPAGRVVGETEVGWAEGVLVDAGGRDDGFRLGAECVPLADRDDGTGSDLVAAAGLLSGTTPWPARSITTQTTVETAATTTHHAPTAASTLLGRIMTTSSRSSGLVAAVNRLPDALPSAHERHPGHRG